MQEKVFFKNKSGIRLCGIWHIPEQQTNKAVILAHGITVTKDEDGIFIDLAELLRDNGYAVFRFDFRGHGESEGKSEEMTIAGELEDLDYAIIEVEKKYKNIGLVGASFGGGVSVLYSAKSQNKLKCLCLWNPCLNYGHCFLNPTTTWMNHQIDRIRSEFESQGWSTLGSRKFKIGKHLFEEMKNLYPYKQTGITLPTLIIHGTTDSYVPFEDSKQFAESLKNGSIHAVENGEHGFQDVPEQSKQALDETLKFFQKYL